MSVFEQNYLKPRDIADHLGLHRTTVYKLIKSGELPHIRIGQAVRVPAAAFQAYLERQEVAEIRVASSITDADPVVDAEVQSRVTGFEQRTGRDPFEFVAAWKSGEIEDTPENAELAIDAIALRHVLQQQSIPA
jgi:excisionase family DNA binding protein